MIIEDRVPAALTLKIVSNTNELIVEYRYTGGDDCATEKIHQYLKRSYERIA